MNSTYYLTTGISQVMGERWDSKLCFEASDTFFDCLDAEHKINVNTKLCGKQFISWKDNCDPGVRRAQMMYRRKDLQEKQLYTQQQLDNYNKIKMI